MGLHRGIGWEAVVEYGLRDAVLEAGNKIVFNDTFILFLAKKPMYSQESN